MLKKSVDTGGKPDMGTVIFVNNNRWVFGAVHCDAIMFGHVVERKEVCHPSWIIPHGIWIVARESNPVV